MEVNFAPSVSLGNLIAALVIILVGYFTYRRGITTVWKGEAEARKEQVERLTDEMNQQEQACKARIHDLEVQVARLEVKTDVTPLFEFARDAIGASEKRFDRIEQVLTRVADVLQMQVAAAPAAHHDHVHHGERST